MKTFLSILLLNIWGLGCIRDPGRDDGNLQREEEVKRPMGSKQPHAVHGR